MPTNTESPNQPGKQLTIFRRLTPEFSERVRRVCELHTTDHNNLAEAGLRNEVLRLEREVPGIEPALQVTALQLRALGVDPLTVLREAALIQIKSGQQAEHVTPEFATPRRRHRASSEKARMEDARAAALAVSFPAGP